MWTSTRSAGEVKRASTVLAYVGMAQGLAAFAGVPFNTWLAKVLGKKPAALICLGVTTVGYGLYAVTLSPAHPYLQIVSAFVVGWGIQGVWIMCQSMTADICDDDEINTGHRREAFYGSALGVCNKAGLAVAAVISGLHRPFRRLCAEGAPPTHQAMVRMRDFFIWSQVAGLIVCAFIFCLYPLTRKRMAEIRGPARRPRSRLGLAFRQWVSLIRQVPSAARAAQTQSSRHTASPLKGDRPETAYDLRNVRCRGPARSN